MTLAYEDPYRLASLRGGTWAFAARLAAGKAYGGLMTGSRLLAVRVPGLGSQRERAEGDDADQPERATTKPKTLTFYVNYMEPAAAERPLRGIARLVDPGGYLVVSGIDFDRRTKVAKDLARTPIGALMEDVHNIDRSLRVGWPWRYGYWGVDPFDKKRREWKVRYASAFQLGATS